MAGTSCTKHVDMRYKFIYESFEDKIVKMVNDSNILMEKLCEDMQ